MLKLNLGCGMHPIEGFINLDILTDLKKKYPSSFCIREWRFQDLLPEYEDNSVDAVTASHSLMYLHPEEYPTVFKEIYRVLKSEGIFRITEDNCERPNDELTKDRLPFGGYRSLTGSKMMREQLEKANFLVYDMAPEQTYFEDKSLIQQFHGKPPRVFHIEGEKNEYAKRIP